jgi:sulfite oxidase
MSKQRPPHPGLIIRQQSPLNAGPSLDHLGASFLTPNELFFIRNHGDVPQVDPASHRLSVSGLVGRPLSLSLDDLRRLPKAEVTATLACAGNRRAELGAVAPIPGELPWGSEAVSNASWGGARLADVLAMAQVAPVPDSDSDSDPDASAGLHAAFAGLDDTERHGHRFNFGGSIPLTKALAPEVLLAYEMNGQPLPPEHGAPLRALVPGYIGARSVKWLSSIVIQDAPSANYFQARAYRLFPPGVLTAPTEESGWDRGMMLGEQSLNSLITSPAEGESVRAGHVEVSGVAVAGAGKRLSRVDVSVDGGASWSTAEILKQRGLWAWRLWRIVVRLDAGRHQLICRAWDSAAQTQPESPAQLWNFKGYMNNAWHRVGITAVAGASRSGGHGDAAQGKGAMAAKGRPG